MWIVSGWWRLSVPAMLKRLSSYWTAFYRACEATQLVKALASNSSFPIRQIDMKGLVLNQLLTFSTETYLWSFGWIGGIVHSLLIIFSQICAWICGFAWGNPFLTTPSSTFCIMLQGFIREWCIFIGRNDGSDSWWQWLLLYSTCRGKISRKKRQRIAEQP